MHYCAAFDSSSFRHVLCYIMSSMLTVDCFGRQVYGPYVEVSKRKGKDKPRRHVLVIYGSGRAARRKKMSYARWLMECHVGRELDRDETVDHKDDDQMNDVLSNFQILSFGDNIRKSHPGPVLVEIKCAFCGKMAMRRACRTRQYAGRQEPRVLYCSRRCAGAARRKR